jgi:hypothetical protein
MDVYSHRGGQEILLDVLVGIEAGVLGGLLMLACLMLLSPLIGQPWWFILNLFASTLYGESPRQGPGMLTVMGAALQLVACGLVGALNALVTPGGRLFGLALAAAWYVLCYLFLWKRFAPLVLVYGSQPLLIAAYFLFGSTLGQQRNLAARARS